MPSSSNVNQAIGENVGMYLGRPGLYFPLILRNIHYTVFYAPGYNRKQ